MFKIMGGFILMTSLLGPITCGPSSETNAEKLSRIEVSSKYDAPIRVSQRTIADMRKEENADVMRSMIFPTVSILKNNQEIGSGFMIKHKGKFVVITARHCVISTKEVDEAKDMSADLMQIAKRKKIEIGVHSGNISQKFNVEVRYVGFKHDWIILTMLDPKLQYPVGDTKLEVNIKRYAAKLASKETLKKIKMFRPVYVIGRPLGLEHYVLTKGVISGGNDGLLGISAEVVPGNSGGPVFDAETHEVIGVVVSVISNGFQIYPHIGYAEKIENVIAILDLL